MRPVFSGFPVGLEAFHKCEQALPANPQGDKAHSQKLFIDCFSLAQRQRPFRPSACSSNGQYGPEGR